MPTKYALVAIIVLCGTALMGSNPRNSQIGFELNAPFFYLLMMYYQRLCFLSPFFSMPGVIHFTLLPIGYAETF